MNQKNKTLVWFLAGAGVILIAIIFWNSWRSGTAPSNQSGTPSTTREQISSAISVPGIGSVVPDDVAEPQMVADALLNTTSKFRSFSISVSQNKFTPSTVIVNVGDRVHLNIKAVDKKYDFTQPDYGFFNVPLPKGETTAIEFQASAPDEYTFFCKSCGGPGKGPVGYVVIVPK